MTRTMILELMGIDSEVTWLALKVTRLVLKHFLINRAVTRLKIGMFGYHIIDIKDLVSARKLILMIL